MEISEKKVNGICILFLSGRFDAHSAPDIENRINSLMSETNRSFILNLEGVDFISSGGIRVLVSLTKKLRGLDGDLILTCVHPSVEDVIDMVDLRDFLTLTETESEAIDKFKGKLQ
jgi:anti-anti-sigma factor